MQTPSPIAPSAGKIPWSGILLGIQPRIDLSRSFDQRQHGYLGYLLLVDGEAAGARRTFTVRIGPAAQARHQFRSGDRISGVAAHVESREREVADFYKAGELTVVERSTATSSASPPWLGTPPALEVYRERGHRRLDSRTYEHACRTCQWGCRMAVEMVVDPWNPGAVKRRFETFCYGPKSCPLYRAGATRKVPGREGMPYEEEDWVDDEATSHRSEDD